MDNKTQETLTEAEAAVVAAEELTSVDSTEEAAKAIAWAYELKRQTDALEDRRKFKNKGAQAKIREHGTWFSPMLKRVEAQRELLRGLILEWMAPGGDIGNQAVEDVRAFGEDGKGNAALVDATTYEVDLPTLVKHHPELVQADMTKIRKAFANGESPKGVTPKKAFTLRIT